MSTDTKNETTTTTTTAKNGPVFLYIEHGLRININNIESIDYDICFGAKTLTIAMTSGTIYTVAEKSSFYNNVADTLRSYNLTE